MKLLIYIWLTHLMMWCNGITNRIRPSLTSEEVKNADPDFSEALFLLSARQSACTHDLVRVCKSCGYHEVP